ncbi:MAG: ABC transporter ATP-binding protein [Candidatus Syntrophonatronum acetioxidans]|uniref:ABC transporter ATP-binding protein n=1 Tax=Candidatus Syntrophonatronum acetioxidans TaxID=1795816 RepID=A0A424YIT7_9FIRM|nr:MAG: ABC transporter ATP-binding protein [Candidatus Syntrophonatronum acetioxidans]
MLDINNLKVTFETRMGEVKVLEKVSLKVSPGERVGIIGESGSGKTTLALSIMGLVQGRVQGSIKYRGEELLDKKEEDWEKIRSQKISMVFQNTGEMLNPVYALIDQVMEPYLKVNPGKKKEAFSRASNLLKKVGLREDHFYAYPFTLSGGEIQRGLIAMALMNEPELIILDEPTSALDALTKGELIRLLDEIARDKTVLVISHDLSTVIKLTRRTAVLYAGSIMEAGSTESLLREPRHPYSRALVRAYPTRTTVKDLQGIRGEFPSLVDPPSGCPFHPRCTQALEKCSQEKPLLAEKGEGTLACHRGGVVTLLKGEKIIQKFPRQGKDGKEIYFNAVDGAGVTLKEGEILALVGESGSGKTTLAQILAGINRPTAGKVYFQEREIYSLKGQEKKDLRRRLQILFQNPQEAVSHRMMVHDLVEEPLDIQDIGDKETRVQAVKEALGLVGLPGDSFFLHKYPHELSGGELQRVTIARALVMKPKVLIADEPSASLDASVQAKILKLLMHLQNEQGFALFLITHDLALAGKVGDRVAVMFSGKIVEEGPTSEIFRYPLHPYTELLLDMAPSLEREVPSIRRTVKLKEEGERGCPYYVHCPYSTDICTREEAPLKEIGFQRVACHRATALKGRSSNSSVKKIKKVL